MERRHFTPEEFAAIDNACAKHLLEVLAFLRNAEGMAASTLRLQGIEHMMLDTAPESLRHMRKRMAELSRAYTKVQEQAGRVAKLLAETASE